MFVSKSANLSSTRSRRTSFEFEDDITYEDLVEEEFPSDIVFPETLNLYLGRQIQEITSENGCLRKALQDAEEKLQVFKNDIVSEKSILPEAAKEKKSTEIIPCCQTCKEQTIEVEVLKSKNRTLNEEHIFVDSQNDNIILRKQLSEKDNQIKSLKEKLNRTNDKISMVKNSNLSLKQELHKVKKITPNRCSYRKSTSASIDSKAVANLRNMEKERRQQIENSATELRQAEIALENFKRKVEAARARIRVLENELCGTKRNVILLNEKKCHDDQLIEALNDQLKAIELRFLDREVEIQNQRGKFERECAATKNELEGAQVHNNLLRQKLEEREAEIQILKKTCN